MNFSRFIHEITLLPGHFALLAKGPNCVTHVSAMNCHPSLRKGTAPFGLSAGTTNITAPAAGETLTIGATGNGTATSITFGTGAGQVKSLNDLNAALASNNLLATIDASGKISITTTSTMRVLCTIGTLGGTAAYDQPATPFATATAGAPVKDAAAQAVRSNLVDAVQQHPRPD